MRRISPAATALRRLGRTGTASERSACRATVRLWNGKKQGGMAFQPCRPAAVKSLPYGLAFASAFLPVLFSHSWLLNSPRSSASVFPVSRAMRARSSYSGLLLPAARFIRTGP